MGRPQYQARVSEEFAEKIEEYCEENHINQSEVVRKGLREVVVDQPKKQSIVEQKVQNKTNQESRSVFQKIKSILTL